MSVNYNLTHFPITNLTPFEFFESQNWYPENIGMDPELYDGVFGEGLNDSLYTEIVGEPNGVFLSMKITPSDASEYEVRAEDFTIAGLNPNYEQESDCAGCDNDSYAGTLSSKKLRKWDELSETTNIIGNPMTIALHPWVSSIIMTDEGPNSANNYVNVVNVTAIIKPQIVIPPTNYNINLDIDGDAILLPIPYSGFEFNVYCKIVGPPNGSSPCARVYPIIPQCYGTTTGGFTLTPIIGWPYTTAGVKVTYNGTDQQAALQFDPACGAPPEFIQGIINSPLQSWFGITPTMGKTLSRFNVWPAPSMYAPPGSNWGFTEEEVNGVEWDAESNPSAAPDGVICPSAYYNDRIISTWQNNNDFTQDGSTATMYDIDGTFLNTALQDFGYTAHLNWRAKLSYTNEYTNEITDYNYWWLVSPQIATGAAGVWGGWPENYSNNTIDPSTAWLSLNSDFQANQYIYFTDTLSSMATTDFASYYFGFQPCDDGFVYTPTGTGGDDLLQEPIAELVEQDPEFFNENNVIVSIAGLEGYIPGANPPDITFEVMVDNCGMYIANDFEEDEWFYFNELNITAQDDEDDQSDDVIISGGESNGGGSFDIDWGDDE